MKHTMKLFEIGMKQVLKDGMLIALIPAPFLVGLFIKLAIPFINQILTKEFSFSIIAWYGLIDGMLICLTPMFVAMISSFLILEERDERLSDFYQITPAEGYSYLFARIGLPMIWAFAVTMIVSKIFNISSLSTFTILDCSIISGFTGIFLAMMVVSIAGNRVEGLALSKLMGISFISPCALSFPNGFSSIILDWENTARRSKFLFLYTWTDILLFVDCLIHKEVFEKSIARDLSLLRYT